jgi:hypothetical protein
MIPMSRACWICLAGWARCIAWGFPANQTRGSRSGDLCHKIHSTCVAELLQTRDGMQAPAAMLRPRMARANNDIRLDFPCLLRRSSHEQRTRRRNLSTAGPKEYLQCNSA